MKIRKRQLIQLIKESLGGSEIDPNDLKFLNPNLDFKRRPQPLSQSKGSGNTVGLTQELALKYYSENPASNKFVLNTGRYRELGGGNIGMDKLAYIPEYGDPIFVTLGKDPITGKPYGKQVKPLVATSRASANWTGSIYCVFGEYEDWETESIVYGEVITQNPIVYNSVPDTNKFIIDTGIYVPNGLWTKRGFARARNPSRMPYVPCLLDSHLTDMYGYFGLIEEANDFSGLIESFN